MQETVFTQFVLPGVLALIMFGMGLSLTASDFVRLFKMPKPVLIGIFGQLIALPFVALGLALVFSAPTEIAIGLMILAACPGGTTSNLISHIAKANLALSVSLTAITTMVCVFTTPLLIKYSIGFFSEEQSVSFSLLDASLGLLVISIVPILFGMLFRKGFSTIALKAEPWFRKLALVFMLLLIVIITYQERDMMSVAFPDVFLLAMGLNIGATAVGLFLAHVSNVSAKDGLTLGIEIGTQNASLAILIAVSFIKEPSFAIAAGVYGVTMYIVAFCLVALKRNSLKAKV